MIEYLLALAMLSIVGTFALRIIYGRQLLEWEQSLGPGRYFVTVPVFLFLLYRYWQRSAKEAQALGQPVVRAWVWVTVALGIVAACAAILAA